MDEPIQFSVGRTKTLNYADKTFLVLLGASSVNSFCSFTFIIGTPIGIVSASVSLVFLIRTGIAEMILKTMEREKRFLY